MSVSRFAKLLDGLLTLPFVLGNNCDSFPDLVRKGGAIIFNLLTEVPDLLFRDLDPELDYASVNSVLLADMLVLLLKACEFLVVDTLFVLLSSKLANALVSLAYASMEFNDPGRRVMDGSRQRLDLRGVAYNDFEVLRRVERKLYVVVDLDRLG